MMDGRIMLMVGLGFTFMWMMAAPRPIRANPEMTERARKFVAAHETKVRPLERAASLAWWNANVTGKDEDFDKKIETQNRIDEALADSQKFRELKEIKESGQVDEPILAREINVLYLQYLEKQVDPSLLNPISEGSVAFDKEFDTHLRVEQAKMR